MITRLLFGNAKAVIAAVVAFLGALQVGMDGGLSGQEVVGSLIAGLVALGGVFAIPNAGMANAQEVVDKVRELVPEETKTVIDEVVRPARGILRTVI